MGGDGDEVGRVGGPEEEDKGEEKVKREREGGMTCRSIPYTWGLVNSGITASNVIHFLFLDSTNQIKN